MSEDTGVAPEDALQVAQRALAKVNDLERGLDELREDHEEAIDKLVSVELFCSELVDDRAYESYSRDMKIGMVREHAYERAVEQGGKAKLDYKDVKWGVFEGDPGASHCYSLLRAAAGSDEDAQRDARRGTVGFRLRDPDDGNIHVTVDADLAKRESDLFAQKKDAERAEVR